MNIHVANFPGVKFKKSGCKVMFKKHFCYGLLVMLMGLTQQAFALTELQDISFASLPGDRFEIKMDFNDTPPEPSGYHIDKPARVVLDFGGVSNALEVKKHALPFRNATSAVILGGEDRTRLIINMVNLDQYQTRTEGNSFFVEVGSNKVPDALKRTSTIIEQLDSEINEFESAITNVDFRRGNNGEGKIIISLSDPATSINVEQLASEIKLNFIDTQLPVNLRRRLDVTDFATPVLYIASEFDGRDSVVSITPQGDYDYLAYQTDNEYVVSVKRLTAQELEEKKAKFTYVGEKLSLNFQDIPVRSVLQIIADFTELNLVASDTIDGTITLRLDNVPWDQALELVLKTKGLDKRQVGNVLMVAPADEIAEQERQQLETNRQLEELAPLRTEFIQVLYADAEDIFDLFSGDGSSTQTLLSERGSAIVDTRTNSIILTETETKINDFRALVSRIDIPIRQVSIEARLVRASTDFAKNLGVAWGYDAANYDNSNPNGRGVGVVSTGGMLAGINKILNNQVAYGAAGRPSATVTDLRAANTGSSGPAQFSLGILDTSNLNYLTLEITAMQSTGQGEVISQPKLVTQDGQEAEIKSGDKVPYQEASASGATATSFEEAVLALKVTPYITPDDRVLMEVEINKDSIGEILPSGASINTTEIKTSIMVKNGETAVIGGIYEETSLEAMDKVPFFGDIPYLGKLFRRTSESTDKTELLIFLTPRVLNDPLASN